MNLNDKQIFHDNRNDRKTEQPVRVTNVSK